MDKSHSGQSVTHRNQQTGCKHKGRSESPFEQLCTGGLFLFTSNIPPLSRAALNPDRLSASEVSRRLLRAQMERPPLTAPWRTYREFAQMPPHTRTPIFICSPPFYYSCRPSQTQGQKELVSSLRSEHAASTDTSVTTSVYLSSRRTQTLFW